ncbi:hypothetical protein F5144DRAFT_577923 [Chaetomium tenue]|uniref:Uncharacterized protein n=1 Tax=Chaetomium tenue TaxID=1854479 RepID=A0ACB7P237_9PEZI|nr:hypothetical protein F5144DRAFT_577923 [Chaetomium globosum]
MPMAMANTNPQPSPPAPTVTRAGATLLTLPTEILITISQNLCLHCRSPRIGELPDDETTTGVHEQTSLAHLSTTCTRLRAVAQPILFHFFHPLADGHSTTRLRLAHLIRTLHHRPDLAACVKSLVLWTPNNNENDDDDTTTTTTAFVRAAAERLDPWWVDRMHDGLEELQELAMALTSGTVGYVLLQRWFGGAGGLATTDWLGWAQPMEGLRHLVLVGWRYRWPRQWEHTFHIKEARALLRASAEGLESLVAVDCGGDGVGPPLVAGGQDPLKAVPWDVELPRLRRLSISGENVGVEEVEAIVRHSEVFEDLELFHSQYYHGREWERDVLDLERHLGTAKKTLKRLCYSAFPIKAPLRETDVCDEEYEQGDSDDDEDYFDPTWHGLEGFEVGFSLKDFSVLETLELEQLVLYGPVFEEPDNVENDRSGELVTTDDFLEKFPPSLVRLRIGCIFYWPIVFRDMLAMADECARFPKLRSVTLEVRRIPPREEFYYLVEAFQRVGIAISICSVVRDPFSRGLLPTRPGFPVRLPEPVCYTSEHLLGRMSIR